MSKCVLMAATTATTATMAATVNQSVCIYIQHSDCTLSSAMASSTQTRERMYHEQSHSGMSYILAKLLNIIKKYQIFFCWIDNLFHAAYFATVRQQFVGCTINIKHSQYIPVIFKIKKKANIYSSFKSHLFFDYLLHFIQKFFYRMLTIIERM